MTQERSWGSGDNSLVPGGIGCRQPEAAAPSSVLVVQTVVDRCPSKQRCR
jgi:hypothetical protein